MGSPKSVITRLFEKMLSASDVGRAGRLVLPKKCAEVHFPTILLPDGLPLKVQDASGKEWVFQFRFWPHSNGRTYVLEGIAPCIQAMQLQAGDTVTFSRIDPEGKLVIGFRKATSASADKNSQSHQSGKEFLTPPDDTKKNLAVETNSNFALQAAKLSTEMNIPIKIQECGLSSQFTKSGFTQKDELCARPSHGLAKRKNNTLGLKIKRLRMKNEDSMELELTWEEAQKFLCAPRGQDPSTVVIEGHEFEEYQEAPVIGRHTYFTTYQAGDFRASCSAAQELNVDQLAYLVSSKTDTSRKVAVEGKMENAEGSYGLDTLPNLATLSEGQNNLNTTRHPRHKLGCTCIICTQPPSGKGAKHLSGCSCNVCVVMKRRVRMLVLRREKRQSENKAVKKKQLLPANADTSQRSRSNLALGHGSNCTPIVLEPNDGTVNRIEQSKTLLSPFKTQQIDLNIRPACDKELLPGFQDGC